MSGKKSIRVRIKEARKTKVRENPRYTPRPNARGDYAV